MNKILISICSQGFPIIHTVIKVRSSPFLYLLNRVYASPYLNTWLEFWNHLRSLAIANDLPWVVLGDFNDVLSANEKFGGRLPNLVLVEFVNLKSGLMIVIF